MGTLANHGKKSIWFGLVSSDATVKQSLGLQCMTNSLMISKGLKLISKLWKCIGNTETVVWCLAEPDRFVSSLLNGVLSSF